MNAIPIVSSLFYCLVFQEIMGLMCFWKRNKFSHRRNCIFIVTWIIWGGNGKTKERTSLRVGRIKIIRWYSFSHITSFLKSYLFKIYEYTKQFTISCRMINSRGWWEENGVDVVGWPGLWMGGNEVRWGIFQKSNQIEQTTIYIINIIVFFLICKFESEI